MSIKSFSIQNIAFVLISLYLIVNILIIGQFFIIPFIFAVLLSIIILPIQHFFDRFIPYQLLSTILAFFTVLIPIVAIITFFSFQVGTVLSNLDNISSRVQAGSESLFQWASSYFNLTVEDSQTLLRDNVSKIISSPLSLLQSTLNSFTNILLNIALIVLFMFFFMAYRKSIKNFILMQFSKTKRAAGGEMISEIQKMLRQYLSGLLTVMIILTILNSLGLWIIGIEYPFLWASLAAFLTIIPYVGTTLGGGLPFFYAMATAASWHQPVAVLVMYAIIQQIEGNFITPFIVGSKVRINPLMAIIGLLLLNAIWGLVGIILAIPITAGIKILLDQIAPLKPIGALMGSNIIHDQNKFLDNWDEDQYRLTSIFYKEKRVKKIIKDETIYENLNSPKQ